MQINFKVEKLNVEPQNGYEMSITIDGYDLSEITEQFEDKEILDKFDTDAICKHFDHSELLDEMNIDFIKEYLKINGETEL